MDKSKEPGVEEMASRVREDLTQFGRSIEQRGDQVRKSLIEFVDEHPLAAVGAAFGVGYLLSGALFSRATLKAVRFGGRFFLGGLVRQSAAGTALGFLAPVLQHVTAESSKPSIEK